MENLRHRPAFEHFLAIPSDFKEIERVQDFAFNVLEQAHCPNEVSQDVLIALQEGVNNAIKHGNGHGSLEEVAINITCYDSHLELRIRDKGPGFDPDCLDDPTDPGQRMRCHGRGLMFMENYMDEICFDRGQGYHELKMIRYLS